MRLILSQRRRRLYFAVDFRGECAGEVLALTEGMSGHPTPKREAGQVAPTLFASGAGTSRTASRGTESEFLIPEVAGTLGHQKGGWATSLDNSGAFIPEVSRSLMASEQPKFDPTFETYIPEPVMVRWASEGGETIQPIADTLRSESEHNCQFLAIHENQRGEITANETAGCLNIGGGKPGQGYPAVLENMRVRRLTPRECERLQGFPDDWTRWGVTERGKTVEISDAQRYKMCGNAVTATVAKWIGQNLMAVAG